MAYVDGFVIAVPKANVKAYKKMAELGKKVWMKHGALDYKECMLDDAEPEGVKLTFPKLAKAKEDETVFFSYIVFESKAHRTKVNKLVMSDPLMNDPKFKDQKMPFDMKRLSYGGFKPVVEA